MAKDDDDLPRKKKTTTWGLILLGLLALGLVGTGITGFGGSIRSIGSVGDREISVDDYARSVQRLLADRSAEEGRVVSLAELQANRDIEDLQSQLVSLAALDNEANRIGLSVGDGRVREAVLSNPGLLALDGSFDREQYVQALRRQGLTVAEFEERLRDEATRTLLQTAILGGIAPPDTFTDQVMDHIAERRSFRFVRIGQEALESEIPDPTEDELRTYYQANTPDFTLPEMKRITYAWIAPDNLIETVEIDEARVRALYDDNIDRYQRPERRLVERLIYPDDATAEAAKARLDAGEASFSDLVEERGLTLDAIDLGEQTRAQLGDAGDAIFELTDPEVVGPLPTSLGPALFRMNGILAEQNIPFEDVRVSLSTDLRLSAARREIDALREDVDDILAAGATLEDLASETALQLGTIDFWDGLGEGIATYEGFRLAAIPLTASDFPEALELEDGGLFAMRLDEVLEPRLQPLEEVESKVLAGWQSDRTEAALTEQANILAAQIGVGAALETGPYPVETAENLLRSSFLDGTPTDLIEQVFALEVGQTVVVPGFGAVFLAQLDSIEGPDLEDPQVSLQRQLIEAQAAQGLAGDIYAAFSQGLAASAGVAFNPTAINAVHAQLTTGP